MICSVTLTLLRPDSEPLEGITVSAFVRGTASPLTADTDSNGVAQFSILSESSVRFECDECAELTGKTVNVPKTASFNVGTFIADSQSEGVGGSGSSDWGSISGTLSDQTDLQSALDSKLDNSIRITDDGDNVVIGSGDAVVSINKQTGVISLNADQQIQLLGGTVLNSYLNLPFVAAESLVRIDSNQNLVTSGIQETVSGVTINNNFTATPSSGNILRATSTEVGMGDVDNVVNGTRLIVDDINQAIKLFGLPSSDPAVVNQLYQLSGVLMISAG